MKTRRKLAVALVIALVTLALGEVALRLSVPQPGFRPFPTDQPPGLYIAHPTRGFAHRPGWSGKIVAKEFTVDYRINALGLRDEEIAPGADVAVLAVGCSFTVGFGAEADEAWPARFAASLAEAASGTGAPPRVVNGAVSAYGLAQIHRTIEELLPVLRPRAVVVGLYPKGVWRLANPYILHRGYIVAQDSSPHYDVVAEGFVHTRYEDPTMQRLHLWTMKHSYIGALLLEALRKGAADAGEDDEDVAVDAATELAPFLAELDRLIDTCRAAQVEVVGVCINGQSRNGSFGRRESEYNAVLAEHARQVGLPLFDPLPAFRRQARGADLRIGDDGHWSRRAHRIAGRELAAWWLADPRLRAALATTPSSASPEAPDPRRESR